MTLRFAVPVLAGALLSLNAAARADGFGFSFAYNNGGGAWTEPAPVIVDAPVCATPVVYTTTVVRPAYFYAAPPVCATPVAVGVPVARPVYFGGYGCYRPFARPAYYGGVARGVGGGFYYGGGPRCR